MSKYYDVKAGDFYVCMTGNFWAYFIIDVAPSGIISAIETRGNFYGKNITEVMKFSGHCFDIKSWAQMR